MIGRNWNGFGVKGIKNGVNCDHSSFIAIYSVFVERKKNILYNQNMKRSEVKTVTTYEKRGTIMNKNLRWLLDKVADYTGVSYSEIDPDRPFMELGFDSQSIVRFIGEVEKDMGVKLDTTALINYPTIKKLSGYLKGTIEERNRRKKQVISSDRDEPIAITGLACRFPEASSPDEFYENLRHKKVSVVPYPEERAKLCGTSEKLRDEKYYNGGYLSKIEMFDNSYFNISLDEAAVTDPQQRLLMQEIVHAFSDAGITSADIEKNRIGMFVGASNGDYLRNILRDERDISAVIGNSMAMISNRMSYFFDLRGPSMTIDTACSSSLVAVAQAVESLERGECDIAVAAGVNIITDPEINKALYDAGMLSPDGICHTFDERANGYVRGEGIGVVVLRKLSSAVKEKSRIYAVILGKAVNQDGRSASITAPNKNMQKELISAACDNAGVSVSDIRYIETHGTGTLLGDYIEVSAIDEVINKDLNRKDPILLGALKTNIGHLESAAGIASLIKTALCLFRGELVPTVNVDKVSSKLSLDEKNISIVTENTVVDSEHYLCGISSFGFGGTNCHIILDRCVDQPMSDHAKAKKHYLIPVSADSEKAVIHRTCDIRDHISSYDVNMGDLEYTAALRNDHHNYRVCFSAGDVKDLVSQIDKFMKYKKAERIRNNCDITLLFSGQGTQWVGMGKGLEVFSAYREKFEECTAKFKEIGHCDLAEIMTWQDDDTIADSYYAQPVIFSVQVSLAALLKSIGVNYNTVCGHSLGEVAAAYVSGAISLASAVRIIHHRSTILRRFTGKGKMLSVSLSEKDALKYTEGYSGLSVGVVNADDSVVISGDTSEIERVKEKYEADGVKCRYLPVNYAFHYSGIEPYKQELVERLGNIRTKHSDIRFISTVTGDVYDHRSLDASYWADNMRNTVRFSSAAKVFAPKSDIVIEIAPSSALLYYLETYKKNGTALVSMQKRHVDPVRAFLNFVSELYVLGCDIDWSALNINDGRYVRLPQYRFNENSCWYKNVHSAAEKEETKEKVYSSDEINEILIDIVKSVSCTQDVPDGSTLIASLELDSLKMFQLNARINSVFGISLRYSDLDKCLTISDVADIINSSTAVEKTGNCDDNNISGLVTDGQMSMIRDQFISQDSNKYSLCGAWRMEKGTVPEIWEKACKNVINRHSVLNLVFEREGREIIQKFRTEEFTVECVSVPEKTTPKEFLSQKLNIPFDLEKESVRCIIAHDGEDWYFGLAVHHCVIDGISLLILIKEIAEAYLALKNGEKLSEEKDHSYFEYQLQEKDASKTKQFKLMCDDMKKELGDARFAKQFMVNCGTDNDPDAEKSIFIGRDVFERLRDYSRKSGFTMFEVLYSVYMLLYYKFTGENRFVTCTYSSGRENVSCFDAIGYYVKLVLTAADIDTGSSMDSFISDNHRKLINAYGYCSGVAIDRLNDMSVNEHENLSHVFVYEKAADGAGSAPVFVNGGEERKVNIGGVSFEKLDLPCTDPQYDIVFMLEECKDDIAFRCHYKGSAYSEEAVSLLMRSYIQLLENVLSDTSLPLGKYSIVSNAEDDYDCYIYQPEQIMFHQYLERYSKESPDAVAAVFGGEKITYLQLDQRSSCLAEKIYEMTKGENTAVGIAVEKSLRFLVSIFAVMKAGGYYVPLDRSYPADRLQYIISDSGMRYVISDGFFDDLGLDLSGAEVIEYSDDDCTSKPLSYVPETDTSRRAYCIYTSGSTGKPKGVIVTHSGIANVVEEQTRLFGACSSDNVTFFASVCFDASVFDILMAIGHGGRLVFDTRQNMGTGSKLRDFLERSSITITTLPSSVLASMKNEGLDDLRVIVTAGEPCTEAIKNTWCMGHEFFNAYGVTEATIWNTTSRCSKDKPVMIGKAVSNNKLLILDHDMNRCPDGVTGELYIGGICLAERYIGLPDMNRKRFVDIDGERFYRTGDLVRKSKNGEIEYIARADNQIKIRGFRVELEEIEKHIQLHPDIENAIVAAVKNGSTEQLVCFIECKNGRNIQIRKLKDELRRSLPHYMIPDRFLHTDSWELNNSGKIDRKLLQKKAETLIDQSPVELPVTTNEKIIAGILEKALGKSDISISDTIVELGVNSIMIYDIITDIEEQTGAVFQTHELLKDITVKELAGIIETRKSSERVIMHRPDDVPMTISEKQYGIWIANSMNRDSSEFNIPLAVKLTGKVDTEALKKAFGMIVERHQIMRVRYELNDGTVTGYEVTGHKGTVETEDISLCSDRTAFLETKIREMKDLPLLPDSFPLYRMKLVKVSENEYYLLFTIHHFIADGWSVRMIFESLVRYYNAECKGENIDEAPLEYQYTDIVYTEKECTDKAETARREEYWKNKMSDMSDNVLSVASDKKRPVVMTHKGRNVYADISGDDRRVIREFSAKNGVTEFCFMTAALAMMLRRCTGQEKINIGFPILGRESNFEKQMVGMFVDTAVAKIDVSPEQSFSKYIKAVSSELAETYEMSRIGLNRIIEIVDPVRSSDNTQLFQVMINMMGFGMDINGLHEIETEIVDDGIQEAKYDFTFYISEDENRLALRLNYYSDVYTEQTADSMLDNYLSLIKKIISADDMSVADYTPVEVSERPELNYQREESLCSCYFEDIRNNSNMSIVHNGMTADRNEMLMRTDKAYSIITDAGISEKSIVGIKGIRKPEFIYAIMAVLKAGAVYTVIDDQWPQERKDLILSSSRCTHYLEPDKGFRVRNLFSDENVQLPEDCSYISVTSGTTGRPKCIAGHNSAVNHFVHWEIDRFGLNENDRFAFLSGIAHDPIMRDLLVPIAAGAAIVLPDDSDIIKVDLFEYLKKGRITVADMTPAIAEVLILNSEKHKGEKLDDLRYVFFGGEKLRRSCAEAVMRLAPRCRVINYYGTTETPQGMAYMEFSRDDLSLYNDVLPVGAGISDVQVIVADEKGRQCAAGEIGNVIIRTKYLAKGYVDDSGSIVPFSNNNDEYFTGDRGKYLSDGSVMILGRTDSQFKRYGHRIEPEEIESAADKINGVKMSRAVMYNDELICFVVADKHFSEERFRDDLAKILALYMIPDRICVVDKIPLTANGKTDIRSLLKKAEENRASDHINEECSELEKKICVIWEKVLNKSDIPVNRTFFETGGSSMKLLILQKELERLFDRDIAVTELFTYPTIRKFAGFIEGQAYNVKERERNNAWNDSRKRRQNAGVFIRRAGSRNLTI